MKNSVIIKAALQEVLTHSQSDYSEKIARYFSVDYRQTVNGNVLLYKDFIKHIAFLHQELTAIQITIIAMAEEGDTVFSHHQVQTTKHDGTKTHTQVMAQFTIREGKIIQCNELTRLIVGGDDDHDLGSRLR